MNLKTAVDYHAGDRRSRSPGRVGVGTWNTAAEFKDIRVERDGRVVYQSDFAGGTRRLGAGDRPRRRAAAATWSAVEGAYRQSGERRRVLVRSANSTWTDVTISLKARKISGAEGFLVLAGTADGRRVQWNVGGWNNRQTAIQAGDTIVGRAVRGSDRDRTLVRRAASRSATERSAATSTGSSSTKRRIRASTPCWRSPAATIATGDVDHQGA